MANQELGMSMSNRECRWVRVRLPLWVGDGGPCPSETNGEGRDLTADDRREIERHLADCTCCREHQIALERAFDVLMAASTLTPVDPHVLSLWPILERRIADHDAIATPQRSQTASGLAGWLACIWTARDRKRLRLGSMLLYSAAASLLVTLVTFTVTRRQWLDAQSMIVGNMSPVAHMAAPTNPVDEALSKISDPDDNGEVLANHLADADLVRLPEATGPNIPPPKPAIHTRLGYDLDHGTLVGPDTRESKPIY
jgi:hypothetical protein